MNKITTTLLATAVCAAACASASAQTTYNQDIGAFIDGTGNSHNGFTQTVDAQNGLTIDLRANNRTDGTVTVNNANVYTYNNSTAPGTTKAEWSYAFQITSTAGIGAFNYFIVANGITENIGTFYPDNSFGSVVGGVPTKNNVGSPLAGDTILANAENITFPPLNASAFVTGQYTFDVYAQAVGSNDKLAETTIIVNVVPEVSSSMALFGVALLGLGAFSVRNRRQLAN